MRDTTPVIGGVGGASERLDMPDFLAPSAVSRATIEPPRLRALTKLSFATGGIAVSIVQLSLTGQVLQYYLNQVVGITPLIVGMGIMITMIFDSVLDPLVGWWSDNFHSPLGRRHPFMYATTVVAPIAFYFVWNAPQAMKGTVFVILMMTVLALARMSGNIFSLTSGALVPELAPGYNERTRLFSYWVLFNLCGAAAMTVLLNAVFLRQDASHPLGLLNRAGYEAFGLTGALVMLVAMLGSTLGTQRFVQHLHAPARRQVSLAATLREILVTLTHPSLVVLLSSAVLSGVGTGITSGLNYYILTHLWGLEPQTFAVLGLATLVSSLVGVALAPLLSSRFGKKPTMLFTLGLSAFTGLIPICLKLVGLMPANGSPWVLTILTADAAVAGTLAIMGTVITASMVSDLVEDNAVNTGVRSEGLMFAALGLTPKITVGVGAFVAGVLLTVVRFPVHAPLGSVPFSLMRHLVLLYLPANAILSALAIAVLGFYRMDKATHDQNLTRLRESGLSLAEDRPTNSAPRA